MSVEELLELVPPSAKRVAERALVLSAVTCRGIIESGAEKEGAEILRRQIMEWVDHLELGKEAEPSELKLLQKPLGQLSRKESIDAGWKAEGLSVLAWALTKYGLLGYDLQADPQETAESLGFLLEANDTVLASAELRSESDLGALWDRLFTLHWRLRQYSLDGQRMNLEEFARTASFGPLPLDGLRLMEQDLEIRGVPLFRASKELWREALSITQERHQAINWLLGDDPIYSMVTTDT